MQNTGTEATLVPLGNIFDQLLLRLSHLYDFLQLLQHLFLALPPAFGVLLPAQAHSSAVLTQGQRAAMALSLILFGVQWVDSNTCHGDDVMSHAINSRLTA